MPIVYVNEVLLTGQQVDINLAPFDRFAGRGGRVAARLLGTSTAAPGDILLTAMVGSDVLTSESPIGVESVAGAGVNKDTPVVQGTGLPADPVTIRVRNTNALTRTVVGIVEIENA